MQHKTLTLMAAFCGILGLSSISSASIPLGAPNDGKLTLVYDPSNGNLSVVEDGNAYGTITLSASASVFKDGVFGTSPEFFSDDNGDGTSLFFGVLTGQQTADVVLPGVLDVNQSQASLLNAITVTGVTNGPAPANITFSGGTTATPEPTSVALMSICGIGLLRRRCRTTAPQRAPIVPAE
ncbi:MAG: PEP-CTERM sorting domain-containing protein [Tepidisphaeraceae bacterium]